MPFDIRQVELASDLLIKGVGLVQVVLLDERGSDFAIAVPVDHFQGLVLDVDQFVFGA